MTTVPPDATREEAQSLWLLVISPSLWAAYFLASYAAAAVWCGAPEAHEFGILRWAIAGVALPVLIGIGMTGRVGWRRHVYGKGELPHDDDTPEDRHRFLGYATLLLSLLSAVATVYVALAAALTRSCS